MSLVGLALAYRTLNPKEGTMQVRNAAVRTTRGGTLHAHERACEAYAAMTKRVRLPEPRATMFRKLRARSQGPNPLERLADHLTELAAAGASEADLRAAPVMLTAHLDRLYGASRELSHGLLRECVEAENSETLAEILVFAGDWTPDNLRTFAKAKRREAMLDLVAADAADMEAARQMRGSV